MAVPNQTPYKKYTANGSTTQFLLGFNCESKDHLIVTIDEVEAITGSWSLSSGNVVFLVAPSSGKTIELKRNTPTSRSTDYQSYNNSFNPQTINKDMDWIWLKLQEIGVADWVLGQRINALKNYVDLKDDELKSYLMEEIRKQGVALDQLDDYYNYLTEQLASIAVEKGWLDSFVATWSGLTQEQKNREFSSAADFGLIGDSKTDNTTGITNAINHYLITKIKILLPDTDNYYQSTTSYPDEVIRAAFYGGGKVRQAGKSALDSNRTAVHSTKSIPYAYSSSSINPPSDFAVVNTRNVNEFKRIGRSPNNVMQGFCHDNKTNEYFTYHVSTTVAEDYGVEHGVINRYSGSLTTGGVFQSVQSSIAQKTTGHQGLSLIYDNYGYRWFFSSKHSEDVNAGDFIIKFKFNNDSDFISEAAPIKVFDTSRQTSATTIPATSPDGRYLVVKRNESPNNAVTGNASQRVRVFDLPKMLNSGLLDWSNDFIYEFTVNSFDLFGGALLSFQGLSVGFDLITCAFGGSSRDEAKKFLTYTIDGRLIDVNNSVTIGMEEAQADDPNSSYEIESVCYSYYLGVPVLYSMVSSGLSGSRIARLFASSSALIKKMNSQISVKVGESVNTVDITNNGYFLRGYRRGVEKVSIYTSSSQTRIMSVGGNALAFGATSETGDTGEWRVGSDGVMYPVVTNTQSIGYNGRYLSSVFTQKVNYTATVFDAAGSDSPEGVLAAGMGSTYRDTKNGDFYVKKTGIGNVGWVLK